MSYAPGNVPVNYDAAFFARELRRIREALNFEDAVGHLILNQADAPIDDTITTAPTVLPIWGLRGPNVDLSDGPIKTDPRITPAGEIEVLTAGIFQVGFFLTFEHTFAVEVIFEFFLNGVRTFFFDGLDEANQQDLASASATAQVILQQGDVLQVRAFTLSGTADVSYIAGEFYVDKIRDLRTRFS